jgi:hypothetical protein
MSVTFADAGEAVSRPCPKMRRYLLTRAPSACQDRLFSPSGYVENLSDARTKLAGFFTILLAAGKPERHGRLRGQKGMRLPVGVPVS